MRPKRSFTIGSFFLCFIFNGIMVGAFFYAASTLLHGLHQWAGPLLAAGAPDVPDDVRLAVVNMNNLMNQIEPYLAPVIFGGGAFITLLLWLSLLLLGRGAISRASRAAATAPVPPREKAPKAEEARAPDTRYVQPSPGAAIQMLSLLQRDGRLVDFLQEDLSMYDDAQIGAAVRNIHAGCKEALVQHMELKPVFEEGEGAEVTIPSGFDSRAIRLTGNVAGNPPFHGVLRHRGWRVTRVQLPQPTSDQKDEWILAPAEVEVGS